MKDCSKNPSEDLVDHLRANWVPGTYPSQAADEIARLRAAGRKIARPWIDGGVTSKEWCDAVDVFFPPKKEQQA